MTANLTESSFRSKRNRECDINYDEKEDNASYSRFEPKRMCTIPTSKQNNDFNTIVNEYPTGHSHDSIQTQEADKEEDDLADDMDVNDDIVSNFNTISFNTSNSQMTLYRKQTESPRASYPVFPPLQRAGRKIDHLVEEVMRKSSRVTDHLLHISIPPSDFEFQMPSSVSVGGGPTRDSRYLTSPDARSLYLAAMHQATTAATKNSINTIFKSKSIQYGEKASCEDDDHLDDSSNSLSSTPPPFHLGHVTHSDWFADNTPSTDGGSNAGGCNQASKSAMAGAQLRLPPAVEENDAYIEEDEDCDDMYVDA